MKNIIILGIMLASLTAYSQNKTNASIAIRVTVEDAVLGTNVSNLKFTGSGTKRDLMMVNGAYWWQSEMVRGQQAALLSKFAAILNTQPELLSDAQKNQLANIAALLP